jgi:hypothetical protein
VTVLIQAVKWRCPLRAVAKADGIVVSVCEPEPEEDASRRLNARRVDQLLAEKPHDRLAENDDALFVKADDSLIRTEFEEF